MMTIHCLFLILNIELWINDFLVGISLGGFLSLLAFSFIFKMCWLYRSFLTHLFLVSTCIWIQDNIGFGIWLLPMRWAMAIFGICLIAFLIKNWKRFHQTCGKIPNKEVL